LTIISAITRRRPQQNKTTSSLDLILVGSA
jgi:hypothetical protein